MKPIFIHADLYDILQPAARSQRSDRGKIFDIFNKADQKFWTGTCFIAHPRYGTSKVWRMQSDLAMAPRPDLQYKQTKSFCEITDVRAQELLELVRSTGKRLAVFWSGGIDSTVTVSALIKNFPTHDLSYIDIYMNNYSFMENPGFFQCVIKKNQINCIDLADLSSLTLPQLFAQNLVTDGEPADKLWLVEIGLRYFREKGEASLRQSLEQGRIHFIDFLTKFMHQGEAEYYWNSIMDNVHETKAPVTTIADLFWWINFNYHWNGHLLAWYAKHVEKTREHWANYQKNYHPWYNTVDYQTWSFGDSSKDRVFFSGPGEYKMEAKQYIFDLHPDHHYLRYKTKLGSGRSGIAYHSLIIMEDGTGIDTNLDLDSWLDQHCHIR